MPDEVDQIREILPYPSLNACFVPVTTTPNEVQFRSGPWSGPVFTVTDRDGDGKLTSLVEGLDGTRHVDEILAAFDSADRRAIRSLLARLYEAGVVYDGEGESSPLRGYAAVDRTLSDAALDRLGQSSVLVFAMGRVGRFVVEDLGWMGVDRLAVASSSAVDGEAGPSVVEPGMFDGDAVERLNEDPVAAVPEFDFVVHAAERPQPALLDRLNTAAIQGAVPWTSARLLGFDGVVGPTVVPGESACYRCYRRRTETTIPHVDAYETYEERGERAAGATLPPFARVVAGTLTADLVRLLGTGFGFTVGSVVHHDFLDHTVESNRVLKLPRCPSCGRSVDTPGTNQLVTMERLASLWSHED